MSNHKENYSASINLLYRQMAVMSKRVRALEESSNAAPNMTYPLPDEFKLVPTPSRPLTMKEALRSTFKGYDERVVIAKIQRGVCTKDEARILGEYISYLKYELDWAAEE